MKSHSAGVPETQTNFRETANFGRAARHFPEAQGLPKTSCLRLFSRPSTPSRRRSPPTRKRRRKVARRFHFGPEGTALAGVVPVGSDNRTSGNRRARRAGLRSPPPLWSSASRCTRRAARAESRDYGIHARGPRCGARRLRPATCSPSEPEGPIAHSWQPQQAWPPA